jgi:HPt (histidine-containing phosphotransfer) domain-containing protein
MMHHKMSYLPYAPAIAINGLPVVNSGTAMTSVPVINPEAIQALRDLSPDGGGEFLRELITIYLADTPKQLAQLEEAISRQDSTVVVRAAHTIKGSSGNFGAEAFAQVAKEIEAHGKANNLSAAAALLPEFKSHYEKVAAALNQLASG